MIMTLSRFSTDARGTLGTLALDGVFGAFTLELPERAVRALAIIGGFGEGALEKAVATVLSPNEAKRHSCGFADLTRIGGVAHQALARLDDARAVADGRKVAADR